MNQGLSVSGWLSLILGWGAILGLSLYCMSRVLFGKKKDVEEGAGGVSRERWATRIGLVLAMAGNAIGLGQLPPLPGQGRVERRRRLPDPLLLRPAPDGQSR